MKSATVVTLALILIFHGPPPARSQETPTSLTRGEYQCQNAFGRSLIALSNGTGACLAACRSTPGRRCSTSFPDPITRDCLDRARAAAEVRVLRQCAGADCPECYDGGDCSDYSQSAFSQTVFDVDSGLSTLFCDDSFSADGLTRAEQRCQQGLARAGGRFAESLEHCFDNCQQAVHISASQDAAMGSSCPASLATPVRRTAAAAPASSVSSVAPARRNAVTGFTNPTRPASGTMPRAAHSGRRAMPPVTRVLPPRLPRRISEKIVSPPSTSGASTSPPARTSSSAPTTSPPPPRRTVSRSSVTARTDSSSLPSKAFHARCPGPSSTVRQRRSWSGRMPPARSRSSHSSASRGPRNIASTSAARPSPS
jgi:hypothetical protein